MMQCGLSSSENAFSASTLCKSTFRVCSCATHQLRVVAERYLLRSIDQLSYEHREHTEHISVIE